VALWKAESELYPLVAVSASSDQNLPIDPTREGVSKSPVKSKLTPQTQISKRSWQSDVITNNTVNFIVNIATIKINSNNRSSSPASLRSSVESQTTEM